MGFDLQHSLVSLENKAVTLKKYPVQANTVAYKIPSASLTTPQGLLYTVIIKEAAEIRYVDVAFGSVIVQHMRNNNWNEK